MFRKSRVNLLSLSIMEAYILSGTEPPEFLMAFLAAQMLVAVMIGLKHPTRSTHFATLTLIYSMCPQASEYGMLRVSTTYTPLFTVESPLHLKFQKCENWKQKSCSFEKLIFLKVVPTELDYSWKRNTAFLLHNQLTNRGEWKCLCRMINSWYKFLWCYF